MPATSSLNPTANAVAAEVAALDGMTIHQLQQRWSELFDEHCASRNRAYLIKRLRYRIQERAFGGLSDAARQRILNLAQTSTLRHRPPREAPLPPAPLPPHRPEVIAPEPTPPMPLSVDARLQRFAAALAVPAPTEQLTPNEPTPTEPTPTEPTPTELASTTPTLPPAEPAAVHPKDPRLPPPGSVLHRVYRGRACAVEVLADGFRFEGQHFKSLSRVALHITGTPWNGFSFFKLDLSTAGA